MNKKIILTLSLALIAIVMATAVSADENITIDGIAFNIPDGYTEDIDSEIVNETDTEDGVNYVSNGKLYENGNTYMTLTVSTYEGVNATEKVLSNMNADDLTINNTEGKFVDLGFINIFCYLKDGKLVSLSSNDKNEIEKFMI